MPGHLAIPPTVYGYQVCFLYTLLCLKGFVKYFSPCGHAQEVRGYVRLPEKVGVPFCYLVIKRPCFEHQIRKTRCYANVVGCSMKILHLELFPGSSAVLLLFTQWVLYRQVLQMVMEWCFSLLVASFSVFAI